MLSNDFLKSLTYMDNALLFIIDNYSGHHEYQATALSLFIW